MQPYHDEDRSIIDRLNGQYVVGISPITEEPINLDEEKKEEEKKGENDSQQDDMIVPDEAQPV